MASIRIKNIGPLVDTGTINMTPVMLFIGKQSTGKSTLMKVLCFCCWIEKKIMVEGESLVYKYTHFGRFVKELKAFHRMEKIYFNENSEIHFSGECITITVMGEKGNAKITRKSNYQRDRHNTKLSFVPSERNMISSIQNINKAYKSSDYDALYNYLWEFDEAKGSFNKERLVDMPFDSNIAYFYDEKSEKDMILLKKQNKSVETMYASSGVQSALPILVITNYLTSVVGGSRELSPKDITNAIAKAVMDKDKGIKELSDVDFNKVAQLLHYMNCQLFIEELEQNLFPTSQFEMVKNIIGKVKEASVLTGYDSRVVMTTHSPYVLTALNLLMKAHKALGVAPRETIGIVPESVILPSDYYSAYWINEEGTLEDIVDREYGFIVGDKLDEISELLTIETEKLNTLIYGA